MPGVGPEKQKQRDEDFARRKFGRLSPIRRVGVTRKRIAVWLCRCDCGKEIHVRRDSLVTGNTLSCDCWEREYAAKRCRDQFRKHGMSKSKSTEYSTWQRMRQRCNDPGDPSYKHYGGRGIKVCERWNDFAMFLSDMGPKPSPELSLERIDNDKGYAPDNCKWATHSEQMRNRRPFKREKTNA